MKILRFLIGLCLVPLCAAATQTLVSLVLAVQPGGRGSVPPSAIALLAGFLAWLFLYFTLPRPMRTYVLAHELTHALWGALMGARVTHMRVSAEGGSVTLSKINPLIALAPYFFPLYTVLVILGYYLLSIFVEVEGYYLWWLGMVGLTWGFHLTFTISMLLQHQKDIEQCGQLFSYAVIYLLNVLGISLWVVIVSAASLEQFVAFFVEDVAVMIEVSGDWAEWLWARVAAGFEATRR